MKATNSRLGWWTRLAVSTASAALAASCSSGGGKSGPSFDSPAAIAAGLNDAGYECDFEADETNEQGTDQSGNCTIERENVELLTFKDNGQRDNYFGLGKLFGCGFFPAGFFLVTGDRWVIQPNSETLAKDIAAKLGADTKHIDC